MPRLEMWGTELRARASTLTVKMVKRFNQRGGVGKTSSVEQMMSEEHTITPRNPIARSLGVLKCLTCSSLCR